MESAFNDTLIANVTTGTATAVSRYVYLKDSSGVRIDTTGEMAGYQAQNFSFQQHYDADGVSYLGSSTAAKWPDVTDYIDTAPFGSSPAYLSTYCNGAFVFTTQNGNVGVTFDGKAWQQPKPISPEYDLSWMYNVITNGSIFLGLGYFARVATSSDGFTWAEQTSAGSPSRWVSGTYGGGLFAVASNGGDIQTSPDGVTWTSRTSPTMQYVWNMRYLNGLFLALADNGELVTSSDGVTWTSRTSTITAASIYSAAYGNGVYVIVASGGKMASSTNGTTWTSRTANLGTTDIFDVAFGAGTFVAAGPAGIASSTDGATWTLRTAAITNNATPGSTSILYAHNKFIVGATAGKIGYSVDGTTWTGVTVFASGGTVRALSYGDGRIIAKGNNNDTAYSFDGVTWVETTAPLKSNTIGAAGYGLGKYLAASQGTITVAYSSDGSIWTNGTAPFTTNDVFGFAASGSIIVAVGAAGSIATSTDGAAWTARTSTFGSSAVRAVCWSGTQFVAVGDDGKLATSPDGITWTSRTSSFSTTHIYGVTYGASTYVAVGAGGKAATSSDGITWTQRTSSFSTSDIYAVTFGDKFVAVGAGVKAASSTDGVTWTQRTITAQGSSVAYGNGKYIIPVNSFVGSGYSGFSSSDGITWTAFQHPALRTNNLYASYGGGSFIIGGTLGHVVVSADGNFAASHTINGAVLAATDGGNGVVAPSVPSAGVAYTSGQNAPRNLSNGVQIRFSSSGSLIGPTLSDRIVRSLAAGTVSNDLTAVGALSCGLLTSYTSPSQYTEVSSAYHADYSRKVNNLAAGTGHTLTLAQAMNFSFPLLATTANITHLAVFKTSDGSLAWVVPLPSAIPSGTTVAGYSIAANAPVLTFTDAATVAP